MHFVDHGPEPQRLKAYRDKYTTKWVDHYERRSGAKPSDSYWREFQTDLGGVFSGLCGYCEADCKGEVDHFRPKSRFPRRVYEWSNWVYACHDCNNSKSESWPKHGYVDPCARTRASRPEGFFDFDLKTGAMILRAGLTPARRKKAQGMIEDLKLNAVHHLKRRLIWICIVGKVLAGEDQSDPGHADFVQRFSARDCPLSSITRALLVEQGYLEDNTT